MPPTWTPARPPASRAEALRLAGEFNGAPERLTPYPHTALENAEYGRGFAFLEHGGPGGDAYVLVAEEHYGGGLLHGAGRDIESVIAEHLAQAAHRNRRLTDAELGPAQRLAVAAYDAGARRVTAPAGPPDATLDYAEHLLVRLRRMRGSSGRALLARDDSLLEAPEAGRRYTSDCPVCGAPRPYSARYPRAVCDDCAGRTTDAAGRVVHGYNESLSGGMVAYYADTTGPGGTWQECAEVTGSGVCFIDGRPMRIGEARFGGIVVQPAPDDGV